MEVYQIYVINKVTCPQCICGTRSPSTRYFRPVGWPASSYLDEQAKGWKPRSSLKRRKTAKSQKSEKSNDSEVCATLAFKIEVQRIFSSLFSWSLPLFDEWDSHRQDSAKSPRWLHATLPMGDFINSSRQNREGLLVLSMTAARSLL